MTKIALSSGILLVDAPCRQAEPANDNFPVKARWQTPAEAIQTIQGWLLEMRAELRADFTLRACREHRQRWELMNAMERCAYWVYFRVRKD